MRAWALEVQDSVSRKIRKPYFPYRGDWMSEEAPINARNPSQTKSSRVKNSHSEFIHGNSDLRREFQEECNCISTKGRNLGHLSQLMNEPLICDSPTCTRISCTQKFNLGLHEYFILWQRAFKIMLIYHPLTWRIPRITTGHSVLGKTDQLRRALSYSFRVIQLTYGVASVCPGNFANAHSHNHVRGLAEDRKPWRNSLRRDRG